MAPAQESGDALVKYEEILKCKDEHIKELEHKVMDLQKRSDVDNDVNAAG